MLDVIFAKDDDHVRLGHAAVVLNILRKTALQLLKSDSCVKGSIASKHLCCAWDFSFAPHLIADLFHKRLPPSRRNEALENPAEV